MTETRGSARTWTVLAVALAVVAVVALVVAVTGQQSPPRPAAAAVPTTDSPPAPTTPAGPPAAAPSGDSGVEPTEEPEPAPEPVSVTIPEIGVTSDLLRLGLQDDGTVEVPPLVEDDQAGWYERGPAPGDVGPATILGHVDSAEHGPGIFFDLGALTPGDTVEVARADGSTAVFAVDRVEVFPKDDFPTLEVYGNTEDEQLRLITCGGDFDSAERSYEDNVVAFATLVDVLPA